MVKFPIICIEEEGCEWLLSKEKNQSLDYTKHRYSNFFARTKQKNPQTVSLRPSIGRRNPEPQVKAHTRCHEMWRVIVAWQCLTPQPGVSSGPMSMSLHLQSDDVLYDKGDFLISQQFSLYTLTTRRQATHSEWGISLVMSTLGQLGRATQAQGPHDALMLFQKCDSYSIILTAPGSSGGSPNYAVSQFSHSLLLYWGLSVLLQLLTLGACHSFYKMQTSFFLTRHLPLKTILDSLCVLSSCHLLRL